MSEKITNIICIIIAFILLMIKASRSGTELSYEDKMMYDLHGGHE